MTRPRYLILAAGVGYRWHDYLGVRKHLLPLDGETVLARTVRQLAARDCGVWVVGPDLPGYRLPDAQLYTPTGYAGTGPSTGTQVDKFLSSRPLWNPAGSTVWLWGDVWWSDDGMDALTGWPGDGWQVWLRPGRSRTTGRGHGEMFAHAFAPDLHAAEEAACLRVARLHKAGLIPWLNTGGWALYRAMLNLPDDQVHGWVDGRNATVIDDWTDDFDQPRDYVTWYGRRAAGRYPVIVEFHGTPSEVRAGWPDPGPGADLAARVGVYGDARIGADQLWCATAHAVEWAQPVIPYSHLLPAGVSWESGGGPIWEADTSPPRVLVTPPRLRRADPARLAGPCWTGTAR
jgi:hypothetical protein